MSKHKPVTPPISRAEFREEIKLTAELLDTFHDTGVSLMTRTVYMGSESDGHEGETGTDSKMAERFLKNLHILEQISDDPIKVYTHNPGGDAYAGLGMYDAIVASPCKIEMYVRGYAMSMGSVILQAADKRVLSRNSTIMIHAGDAGYHGHSRTFVKWAKESERIDALIEGIYLDRIREKHPRFSLVRLKEMLDHDYLLSAAQAVELGLADKIG